MPKFGNGPFVPVYLYTEMGDQRLYISDMGHKSPEEAVMYGLMNLDPAGRDRLIGVLHVFEGVPDSALGTFYKPNGPWS